MKARSTLALPAAVAAALALLAPSAGGASATIVWQGSTPDDGTAFAAGVGRELRIQLEAAGSFGSSIRIRAEGLPAGARLVPLSEAPARADFRWTPRAGQRGEWRLVFRAVDGYESAPRISVHVHVGRTAARSFRLSSRSLAGRTQNAALKRVVVAYAAPSETSRVVGRLRALTPEHVPHVVFLSQGLIDRQGRYWVRVPLPKLPNGTTGWIPRDAVGSFAEVDTHLVIERAKLRATLYERGRPVFRTIVGVGKPHWPTPAGRFYVRERLTGFTDPIYGSLAFGTNGRSAVLTDWPGGGFIGIHGTNQPEILPGRVSHGCVRMRNPSIRRLDRLMRVGTPVTIR
ncbi:MAG TPA: L,D-transpeptidase family protein [Gaiellaceae bacterium]|nr:L,D-transpeptidase family protein [Gaiellaceae bacterium]